MGCDKGFSGIYNSYMVLDPEKVSLKGLIQILFSSNIEKRKFVDSDQAVEESFQRRWLMLISILVQKLLLFVAKPLACIGDGIETWLNLCSSNRNFFFLIFNFFRGKVVQPEKNSARFVSFIGNLDNRLELDRSIKPCDPHYYAFLSMMASKASYENKAYLETTVNDLWQMQFLGFFDFWNDYRKKPSTQAFILHVKPSNDHDTIIVAFRGTEPFNADDWCSDFDISWYELPNIGRIHGGFMKALGLKKDVENFGWPKEPKRQEDSENHPPAAYYAIRDMLKQHLTENDKAKFILTGHSLGGALAIIFPAVLVIHEEEWLLERLEGVYTFGQPRVGDEKFGVFMEKKLKEYDVKYFRFVYGYDMVPRLPYDNRSLMFKHFGTCIYYDRNYQGKVVEEEPNKNYFSLSGLITMKVNALLELIRSFTISYSKGPDYREGLLLRSFRIIGLILPGIPAHCPQDYVNATRLGSSHIFSHCLQP